MPDTVVVTGATGAIGRHVVPALERSGRHVVATSRRGGADVQAVDLGRATSDFAAVLADTRPQAVIHLAAAGVHGGRASWGPLVAGNVLATATVIDAAVSTGVERVVHVSSDVAGEASDNYGLTKRMAELLVERVDSPTTRCMNVRLPVVFGPEGSSSNFVRAAVVKAASGGRLDLQTPDRVRGFLHVDDAAEAIIHALDGPVPAASTVRAVPALECELADFIDALSAVAAGREPQLPEGVRETTVPALSGWRSRRSVAADLRALLDAAEQPTARESEGAS